RSQAHADKPGCSKDRSALRRIASPSILRALKGEKTFEQSSNPVDVILSSPINTLFCYPHHIWIMLVSQDSNRMKQTILYRLLTYIGMTAWKSANCPAREHRE